MSRTNTTNQLQTNRIIVASNHRLVNNSLRQICGEGPKEHRNFSHWSIDHQQQCCSIIPILNMPACTHRVCDGSGSPTFPPDILPNEPLRAVALTSRPFSCTKYLFKTKSFKMYAKASKCTGDTRDTFQPESPVHHCESVQHKPFSADSTQLVHCK